MLDVAVKCRKYSVLIFGLHMFVYFYLNGVLVRCGYMLNDNSVIRYLVVVIITVIISDVIIRLSEKKGFRWLKIMY